MVSQKYKHMGNVDRNYPGFINGEAAYNTRYTPAGNNIYYIFVPKSGSTSIRTAIGTFRGDNKIPSSIISVPTGSFLFSFVRNPYKRIFSCWADKITNGFKNFPPPFNENMTFESFVDNLLVTEDKRCNFHYASQYSILTKNGILLPNFIGRVENFNEDWNKLSEMIKVNLPPLPVSNKSKASDLYNDSLTEELKGKIYERYRKDFELWYEK